jgi:hypothetical protein
MTDIGDMPLIENAFSGIVLTAQTFNPSIFTETWLSQNDIIPAEALEGVRLFSPDVAQFQTPEVQVLVIPPKMQIRFSILEPTEVFEMPLKIASRTVELLPHTPYQALGLNFEYFVTQPESQNFNNYDRALLGSGDYKLLQEFSSKDAKFGRYFSKDYGESRFRLNIKPVKAGPDNKDMLEFSFNFHHDVARFDPIKRSEKLIELIGTWDSLRQYAQKLLELGGRL